MSDFDSIVLGPDDFVILRSKSKMTAEYADRLQQQIPERLQGRVLVIENFDVFTFHPVRAL